MHSLTTQNAVRRFRIASILVLQKWLCVSGFVGLAGYAVWSERRDLMGYALGFLGLALVVWLGHWMVGGQARCPLCFVPSFSHQRCAKSRKAHHFMGSYRVFVALGVLFKGGFRCPYCGEATAMMVRPRPRNSRGR